MASIARRAASALAKYIFSAADPANEAGRIIVYAKAVAGVTQLFAISSDGTVTQLTPSGNLAPFPELWSQLQPGANQAATAMACAVSQLFDDRQAIRAFSVCGLGLRSDANVTAGTATAKITKNGVAGTLNAVMTAGNSKVQAVQAPGIDVFAAGDLLGMTLATDNAFLPVTTLNFEAWAEISYQLA